MHQSLIVCGLAMLVVASSGCSGSVREGTAGSALAASALAGTWDLTATPTSRSASTSGSLVITPSRIELTVGGSTLVLEGRGSAITLTSSPDVHVTHEPAPFDTGALPLDVGGIWLAASADGAEQCHARLTTTAFSGDCSAVDTGDWGLALHGSVHGTRALSLASSFGDLGGAWTVIQGDVSCTVVFEGNDFSLSCIRDGVLTGSLSAHVTDSLASGTSSTGTEFAARRRGPTG
jgi:hypothetical protein